MTIPDIFTNTLIVASVVTALVTIKARAGSWSKTSSSPNFKMFQLTFLVIYYISMTADWLQGPYVYALYSSYGFSSHDIAVLFVGGFGASMVFGTFVGAMADKMGRKRACQLYCVLYVSRQPRSPPAGTRHCAVSLLRAPSGAAAQILSCVTKHAKDYWVLMLGRMLGGVATSLLFSSFESWLICE